MKTTIYKSSFDDKCAEVAKSMQGYRPLTDEEAEQLAEEETNLVGERLRKGLPLTTDQAGMAAAVGISPHSLMSIGGKPCLPGFVQPADQAEEELRKAKRPTWALCKDTYFRALEIASDKGKAGDVRYVRRLYERLHGPVLEKGERLYSEEELLKAASDYLDAGASL